MKSFIMGDSRLKRIAVTLGLWAIILTTYMTIGYAIPPSGHRDLITLPIDRLMPFVPATIFIYTLFFYVPLFLAIWLIRKKQNFYRYILSIIIGAVINFTVFVFFPIAFIRPELGLNGDMINNMGYPVWNIPNDILSPYLMSMLYSVDATTCTFPSTHITYAVCLAYGLYQDNSKWAPYMAFNVLLLVLVIMTTKQHYFLDGVTGVMTGLLAGYFAFSIGKKKN